MMATDTTPVRNDALARASALANRARDLRRAQSEVQELTAREVQVLARTAASFFDSIPLTEFTSTLMPHSARGLRRIRHRILHRTIHNNDAGMLIRALLLGRDGNLRLFSARSADARDLLLIMEPGRSLPVGVVRDVVDWTPTLRVPGFRPFEILDKLSHSLDAVEEQIADAEERVAVQKAALTSGDLSALLPPAVVAERSVTAIDTVVDMLAAPVPQRAIAATTTVVAAAPPPAPLQASKVQDPFDMFELVEALADAAGSRSAGAPRVASAVPVVAEATPVPPVAVSAHRYDDEPEEWDDPEEVVEPPTPSERQRTGMRSIFPEM